MSSLSKLKAQEGNLVLFCDVYSLGFIKIYGTFHGAIKCGEVNGNFKGEDNILYKTDTVLWRYGEKMGLETPAIRTENDFY